MTLMHHSSWLWTGQSLNHICWHWSTSLRTSLIRHIDFLKFSFSGFLELSLGINKRCERIFWRFTWAAFTLRRNFLFQTSPYSQMSMMKSSTQSSILMEMKRQALAQGFLVMYIPFFEAKYMIVTWLERRNVSHLWDKIYIRRSGRLWEWFWWKGT